jgi:hypothetical protein
MSSHFGSAKDVFLAWFARISSFTASHEPQHWEWPAVVGLQGALWTGVNNSSQEMDDISNSTNSTHQIQLKCKIMKFFSHQRIHHPPALEPLPATVALHRLLLCLCGTA